MKNYITAERQIELLKIEKELFKKNDDYLEGNSIYDVVRQGYLNGIEACQKKIDYLKSVL